MGKLRLVLLMEDINRIVDELGYSSYGHVSGIEDDVIRARVRIPGLPGEPEIWLTNFKAEDNDLRATVGASNWLLNKAIDTFVGHHEFGPLRYQKPTVYVRIPDQASRFMSIDRIYIENHALVIEATSKIT